jgi:hypothetical protein
MLPVKGIYWWFVDYDRTKWTDDLAGFNPLGKPAERQIAKCYRG